MTLEERAARIRLILLDVDGVLTDGGLYYGPEGEGLRRFDVKDGHGLVMWRLAGGRTGLLSARHSKAVERRAAELQLDPVLLGRRDKRQGFSEAAQRAGVSPEQICFVGDETNDLAPLELAGLAVAPSDAVAEARHAAQLVTQAPGGHGAIRELVERLLRIQGKWDQLLAMMRG